MVRGARPERWVRQTDFDNDEAVGYLADRLARLGVEDELAKAGAVAGAAVTIGEVTFDWEPTPGRRGARSASGPRGTDARLETTQPDQRGRAAGRVPDPARRASTPTRPSRWRSDDVPAGGARPAPPPGSRRPAPAMSVRDAVRRANRRRRQGRLVLADHRRRRPRPGAARRAGRRARRPPRRRHARSCWSPPGPSRPGWRRWRCRPARATWPPSRRRRASARCCWSSGTPRRSPGPASPSARCCSPPTTWSAGRTTATPTAPWSGCCRSAWCRW